MMSFDLHDASKESDSEIYFDQKSFEQQKDSLPLDHYHENLVVPKDLFESISESHYLTELHGNHEENLSANEIIDSLVQKGCEENQISHYTNQSNGDYNEEDEQLLLDSAPVSDIIERLEKSLGSPERSSITAAQGLLHLQNISKQFDEKENSSPGQRQTNLDSNQCDTPEPYPSVSYSETIEKDKIQDSDAMENFIEINTTKENEYSEDTQPNIPSDPDNTTITENGTEHIQHSKHHLNFNGHLNNLNCFESTTEETFRENIESMDNLSDACEHILNNETGTLDLSRKSNDARSLETALNSESSELALDDSSNKSDDIPKDLSCHRRAITPISTPKRQVETPRPVSRGSDAMQSPQPSGIPAVPSSPEPFTVPQNKTNKSLFLETLLASPSPKMCFSSELTITKHQNEPLNLGKSRKSASPTVSSCSDEIKKFSKEFDEPEEKKIKREAEEKLLKLNQKLAKVSEAEVTIEKICDEASAIKQLQQLKSRTDFTLPDPLLIPRTKLNDIFLNPGKEIPALLLEKPELRLPDALMYPTVLQDLDILVISVAQLEAVLQSQQKLSYFTQHNEQSKELKSSKPVSEKSQSKLTSNESKAKKMLSADIDAATSAAFHQMLWLPYLSQLEAAAAACQTPDLIKSLNHGSFNSPGTYPDISQMFAAQSRFMHNPGLSMMPQLDYNNQLELAMWQEAMNQTNNSNTQRSHKQISNDNHLKDLAKATEVVNHYNAHPAKPVSSRSHSSARTSPITQKYNSCQRSSMNPNHYLPNAPYCNSPMIPTGALPGLQMPGFNVNSVTNNRNSRYMHPQQKSPTSPYYQNNNYLQSSKQPSSSRVAQSPTQKKNSQDQRDPRTTPTYNNRPLSQNSTAQSPVDDSQKPRISVKNLQNLLEPSQTNTHQSQTKRGDYLPYHNAAMVDFMSKPSMSMSEAVAYNAKLRRQMMEASAQRRMLGHDEAEVGSTTPLDDAAMLSMHDPHTSLWHPLFGNQKGYNSPWNWTTVTVNGE